MLRLRAQGLVQCKLTRAPVAATLERLRLLSLRKNSLKALPPCSTVLQLLDSSDNLVCQGAALLFDDSLAALAAMSRLRALGIRPGKAPWDRAAVPDYEAMLSRRLALAAALTQRLGSQAAAAAPPRPQPEVVWQNGSDEQLLQPADELAAISVDDTRCALRLSSAVSTAVMTVRMSVTYWGKDGVAAWHMTSSLCLAEQTAGQLAACPVGG